jgi:hypothetical protein
MREGLAEADFERKRALLELLVDRVIVTDGVVEIRYVVPTGANGEREPFWRSRTDYRGGGLTLQAGDRRWAPLAHGPPSGDRGGDCRSCPGPDAGARTLGVCPNCMSPDGVGVSAFASLIRAPRSVRVAGGDQQHPEADPPGPGSPGPSGSAPAARPAPAGARSRPAAARPRPSSAARRRR